MNRPIQASGPRYIARFTNGAHQVFDTVYYGVVDAKRTAKDAEARAAELNARPPRAKTRTGGRK